MTELYTPTTEKVRALYVEGAESEEAAGEQFDRWLEREKLPAKPFIRYQNHWIDVATLTTEQMDFLRASMTSMLPVDTAQDRIRRALAWIDDGDDGVLARVRSVLLGTDGL